MEIPSAAISSLATASKSRPGKQEGSLTQAVFESLSRLGEALADLLCRKGARAVGRVQFLRFADQQKFETPAGLVMKDLRQFAYFGRYSQQSPVFHLDHFRFAIFAHYKVGEEARQEIQWTVLRLPHSLCCGTLPPFFQ